MRYCEVCRASFQALRTCPRDGLATRADVGDPLLESVLGGRYRVLERLAAGGMGQVYRAAHTRIASLFAVKVLYGDIAHDATMRARFQREAEAAACLQSRHIVRIVDFDESPEELLYIVMEHLDGPSLSGAITQAGSFSPDRAVHVATQIARGLGHAHERGIVHRDLKPGNVMLIDEDDDTDVVRLLDFGIARIQEKQGLTEAGAVLGTPQYMAPEQFFSSGNIDARADLYALGVILFEMLTGDPPFEASSLPQMAACHVREPVPSIASRNPGANVPEPLEAIVRRLLAKRPDERFHSARAVVDALKSIDAKATPSRVPASFIASHVIGDEAVERIRDAIQRGAPAYNAGDHAGCFAIYSSLAEELCRAGLRPDTALASSARLRVGLLRAASCANATQAAWEMRYAFDDLLDAGTLRGGAGALSAELTASARIAAPRYAMGHLDLVGDYYALFAGWLAQRLRQTTGDATVAAKLEDALASAGNAGGQAALATVGQTLDALRQGLRATTPHLPTVTRRLAEICPRAEEFSERILHAIALGAPAYNTGDIDACYRIYKDTAAGVVRDCEGDPGCAELRDRMSAALEKASRVEVAQAAWVLRHAFDGVIAEVRGD